MEGIRLRLAWHICGASPGWFGPEFPTERFCIPIPCFETISCTKWLGPRCTPFCKKPRKQRGEHEHQCHSDPGMRDDRSGSVGVRNLASNAWYYSLCECEAC